LLGPDFIPLWLARVGLGLYVGCGGGRISDFRGNP